LPSWIISEKDRWYHEEERIDKIIMEHSNSLPEKVGGGKERREKKQEKKEAEAEE
jgi:hypothetical protein